MIDWLNGLGWADPKLWFILAGVIILIVFLGVFFKIIVGGKR